MNPKAETCIPSDSVSKSSKSENESSTKTSDKEKQEYMQNIGPLNTSSLKASWQISQHYYPDVVPLVDHVIYESIQPEFLMKLPPEITAKQQDNVSLYYLMKGIPSPYVISQWMVADSRSYSPKHDGPLRCLNVMNIGPNQGGIYTCKNFNAAGDNECNTQLRVKTGWHLHALLLIILSGYTSIENSILTLIPYRLNEISLKTLQQKRICREMTVLDILQGCSSREMWSIIV